MEHTGFEPVNNIKEPFILKGSFNCIDNKK